MKPHWSMQSRGSPDLGNPEHALHAVAEQAAKADDLVKRGRSRSDTAGRFYVTHAKMRQLELGNSSLNCVDT